MSKIFLLIHLGLLHQFVEKISAIFGVFDRNTKTAALQAEKFPSIRSLYMIASFKAKKARRGISTTKGGRK